MLGIRSGCYQYHLVHLITTMRSPNYNGPRNTVNVHSPTPWAAGETLTVVFASCLCHIVCLQLHVTLSMGGRGFISHFKRGYTT